MTEVKDALKAVPEDLTVVEIAKKVLDGKENVSFIIENRVSAPLRQESRPRQHVFHNAGGFAEYLRKYKTENTVVLIDVDEQKMSAVLDEKAVNGFEVVEFCPQVHPMFEPWEELLEGENELGEKQNRMLLREFVEFLTVNRKTITEPDAKELVMLFSQVKVSKNITLQSGMGKHSINGIVCEQDIKGQTANKELDMPETLKLHCPIYVSTPYADIDVDVMVDTIENKIIVSCFSPNLIEEKIAAFDEMADIIKEVEGLIVCYGKPNYGQWQYVQKTK